MSEKANGLGAGLLIGVAIGLVIGILYAPRAGKETRAIIGEKLEDAKDKTEEILEEAKKRAKKIVENAKGKAAELRKKEQSEEAVSDS